MTCASCHFAQSNCYAVTQLLLCRQGMEITIQIEFDTYRTLYREYHSGPIKTKFKVEICKKGYIESMKKAYI